MKNTKNHKIETHFQGRIFNQVKKVNILQCAFTTFINSFYQFYGAKHLRKIYDNTIARLAKHSFLLLT